MFNSRRRLVALLRAKNFLLLLLRNRMAAAGIITLIFFSILAILAPVLTPFDPQATRVAAPFSPPVWMRYLPGGEGLSENIDFPDLLHETTSPAITANVISDKDATIVFDRRLTSGGEAKVLLRKTLDYPYQGPSGRFLGNAVVKADGVNSTSPLHVRLYFNSSWRPEPWTLWDTRGGVPSTAVPVTNSTRSYQPLVPLDSNNLNLQRLLGLEGITQNPASIVFPTAGKYEYVLELTFSPEGPGPTVSVTVNSFEMRLFGTSFGLLGTNHLGLDVFTQMAHGARISLMVGIFASIIGVAIGLIVGLMAGYLGRLVDETLMRFTDMILVIPGLPLLLILQAVLGRSFIYLILLLGLLSWEGFARVIRSQVLTLKERPFVESAKAAGAGTAYIVGRHIFPNLVALTYIALATAVPGAILAESALSFLGFFDPQVVSWGRVVNEATTQSGTSLARFWWWILPPGFAIAVIALSFILIGYSLDEIFNPKLRKRR